MKTIRPLFASAAAGLSFAFLLPCTSLAQAEAPQMSAADLASKMDAVQGQGTSLVRLRMEIKGAQPTTLQVQIKERRSRGGVDLVYQVLWPKERKGESFLIRKGAGRAATGAAFTPPDKMRTLGAGQMSEPVFGSDLSYQDLVENFFAWDQQTITGEEVVDRVNCVILESKPGKGDRSSYSSVRSWIDARRLVPLRVEKYAGQGRLVRRIDTTKVFNDGRKRFIPANLTVSGPGGGSSTDLDGSRIKHDVAFNEADFTPDGLRDLGSARAAEAE